MTAMGQDYNDAFNEARENGKKSNEAFNRSVHYVQAWMKHADPITGLIPRNLTDSKDYWNAWDAAADNYPFMVLTASILMPEFFKGRALDMLNTEKKLTPRIGRLPDTYSFSKRGFKNETIDTSQIIFGTAEYMKDGLIPLTEWLGQSPWSDRLLNMLDDLPALTDRTKNISGNSLGNHATVEVNGDLLQVLARMYWFTGKQEYLDRAVNIADYYLNEEHLPTNQDRLRIRDHGCEIISGLCEAYIACYYSRPEKYRQWKKYVHLMLDQILKTGRNKDGLFYDEVNPKTGAVIHQRIADNFGYTLNAYLFISKMDSTAAYRDAVLEAMNSLNNNYRNHNWEGNADGYADAIEGTLNLYNREPIPSAKAWLDSEILRMWAFQKTDGMIEGWHGDGNFARTSIMYGLWKTQGITPVEWSKNLFLGAVQEAGQLKIALSCATAWNGKIKFDIPRYRVLMHYPVDYPRINQFQEWFTVDHNQTYRLRNLANNTTKIYSGKQMAEGIQVRLEPAKPAYFIVEKVIGK